MGAKFGIAISNILRGLTFPYLVWYRNGELLSNRKRGALTKILQIERTSMKALKSGGKQKEWLQEKEKGKVEIEDQVLKF